MNKTIKLEDSTARKLYKTATPELKIILEENWGKSFFSTKIIDRIDSWEDICNEKGIDPFDLPYKNPKTKLERHLNASFKINHMTELLNEDTILDWNDRNQPKYYLFFEKTSTGWVVVSYFYYCGANLGSGFYYRDKETALAVGKKPKLFDIYLDYLPE